MSAEPTLTGLDLSDALRGGGFNLYCRHVETDWSQRDRIEQAGQWTNCDPARARQLSDEGRDSARRIGEAIRALDIPVGRVLASPYCRTVETAESMDIGPVETTTDVINMRVADYFGGRKSVIATARALLSTIPPDGTNTVIVAHGNVAREATPVYPGEGECAVFRPGGDGTFHVAARVAPGQWRALVKFSADSQSGE